MIKLPVTVNKSLQILKRENGYDFRQVIKEKVNLIWSQSCRVFM